MKAAKTNETFVTRNLIQFCYTCDDAGFCTTEEQCRACWTENGVWNAVDEDGARETRALLMAYYE